MKVYLVLSSRQKKNPDPATSGGLGTVFRKFYAEEKNRMETSIRERRFVPSDLQASAI